MRKRSVHRSLILVASSCAATLVLVVTASSSCGTTTTQSACAQSCPDVAELQAELTALQAAHDALSSRVDELGPGPEGPEGPEGPPGATNVVVRTQSFDALASGNFTIVGSMCEEGERAVGGGGGFTGNAGSEVLQQSYPLAAENTAAAAGDTPIGWRSIVKNEAGSPQVPVAWVVCAQP